MRQLVLAAVVGAVLAVGLHTASANGGTTNSTIGQGSKLTMAFHGPFVKAIDHLCMDHQGLTTGNPIGDDALFRLCTRPHFAGLRLGPWGQFSEIGMGEIWKGQPCEVNFPE
jgi:hypothetical protein